MGKKQVLHAERQSSAYGQPSPALLRETPTQSHSLSYERLRWLLFIHRRLASSNNNDIIIVKKQPFLAALHPFHVEPQFPGDLAAHGTIRLTLLPSGPDVVHEAPLRKTQALRPDLKKDIKMAESERFELSIQVSPYTRFPGVLLQPLGQLSTMLYYKKLFSFVALPRDCRLQRYISYHLKLILSTPFLFFHRKISAEPSAEILCITR